MSTTPLLTKTHSLPNPKGDIPPTSPRNPRPIFIAVYSNAAQAGLEPVNPMCISAPWKASISTLPHPRSFFVVGLMRDACACIVAVLWLTKP
eukprot:scaffold9899_cov122-Isochrysis_galbana.AAC.4